MSLLKSLARSLTQQVAGRRTWTPAEVRELLDRKAFDEARRALEHLPPGLDNRDAVRECLLGEVLFQQRDDTGAMQAFQKALKLRPGLPSAHYGLSLLMAEEDQLDSALRHAFFANSVEPNDPRFIAQVGYCQLRLGNPQLAEAPLRRASLLMPHDGHVWNNLALVLLARGQPIEAHDCLRLAVEKAPQLASAKQNLINLEKEIEAMPPGPAPASTLAASQPEHGGDASDPLLFAQVHRLERGGDLRAAIDACEALVLERPDDSRVALELHRLYRRAGDPASGVDALEAFRNRRTDDFAVAGALGLAYLELRKHAKAERLLRQAVEALPERLDLITGLARALNEQERFEQASEWIERARAFDPDSVELHGVHAMNLVNQCRYEEALSEYEVLQTRGIKSDGKGVVLSYLGRFNEAERMFNETLASQPNEPSIRFHRANLRLLRHDFACGWEDYAFRAYTDPENFRVLPYPLWRGESLAGKRILVLAEQGLGDQVMFASCLADLLAEQPRELIVEAQERIAPTLQRSFPMCRVIPTRQSRKLDWLEECGDVDCYIPLGDLPGVYRRSLESFPKHDGFLKADPDRVAHWRRALEAAGPGPYVGFSWKGGTPGTRTKLRTMGVMDFAPLAATRSATWVCLQYGDVSAMVADARNSGFAMQHWPEAIADLDEFAALVSALDLVITVCNTTVHYAGACNRPVWVLAPKVPEWRYGAQGRQLPWYPSAVIYRQALAGDWDELMTRVRRDWSVWPELAGAKA